MSTPEYDDAKFRQMFPEFADPVKYPAALIEEYWTQASCYIVGEGNILLGSCCSFLALGQMTAHMMTIAAHAAKGKQAGYKTGATVDKVSVSYAAPPAIDQFSWWLSTTPYGAALAALLEVKAAGGFSVGGLNERGAFKKVGGVFF